ACHGESCSIGKESIRPAGGCRMESPPPGSDPMPGRGSGHRRGWADAERMLDRIPFGPLLVLLTLLSAVAFPVPVVVGVGVRGGLLPVPRHVGWAIPATLLCVFAHSIIMFYFIGTGSRIKEVVKEFRLDPELYRRTLGFKQRVFPLSTLTMGLVMAAY